MKTLIILIVALVIIAIFATIFMKKDPMIPAQSGNTATTTETATSTELNLPLSVTPVSHATAILTWDGANIYTDPVGEDSIFEGQADPDLILLTDIHSDHLSTSTLASVMIPGTTLIAPQAVADLLPENILERTIVLENGATTSQKGFVIEAIPMYNLPENDDSRHVKGRGNGYLLERDGTRVYIAGDTSDIAEMRELEDIDLAFIPMNQPFTMSVESAADAVLAFAPRIVYPYHYRRQDGLSDINKFKQLVNEGNPDIEVVLADWYPND
jgi:L-ascorbate metabolism protein UlaG (beta-lactamase superfamily)